MSQSEVEPYIARSIKLLLSNDEDSCEQLRAILEESIRIKYGARKAQAVANLAVSSITVKRKTSSSYSDEVPFRKIRSGDSCKSSSSSPALTFETESSGGDSEDLTLEILEENLCVICRNVGTSPRNRIVECMDCHNLYHQNCATPPIDADVNDPRFVWYCSSCSKGSSKMSSSSLPATSRASSSGSSSTSTSGNNSSSNTSKSSSSKSSSSSSRSSSQSTTYAMVNKPFGGNKFRLLKSVKR